MKSLTLCLGIVVFASCSTSCSSGPGSCTGDLSEVGQDCPRTFDGTEANLPACRNQMGGLSDSVWSCQDLIALSLIEGFTGGIICYYDATSHELVGATWGSDISMYCDGSSLTLNAGRTNQMCLENAPLLTRSCP